MAGLVEKIWFDNHPLGWIGAPLLWPLSKLFGAIAKKRRAAYLAGTNGAYKAPVPVIVVGNITVGGNGKTPVVVWLVEQLKAKGFNPGVVSRGYGGKAGSYPFIVDENTGTEQAGDEPVLIYQRTQAPVAISPVRSDAVKALLPLGVDIVITDDGLQHYKLGRDIEFVIVDGERRFGNGHYMPLGPLREQTDRLSSVDFVVCNGGEAHAGEVAMTLKPAKFINLKTGERVSAQSLKAPVAFAGIGNPQRFFNTLQTLGINPVHCEPFADHKAFEYAQLDVLAKKGQNLLMTEKDAVKCRAFINQHPEIENWWYLPVDAVFSDADTANILNNIMKVKDGYGSPTA
ncbi:tetraacyldisaccharide 4'-kinase [Grimontia hollisae]|uniref:Tetraacyldisaccharide 4'-kinase n=2 Tax=Grimontia hollisae TaxID=673 RepID=D0IA10_GRIHO|nr:tetraacyldisaccharide 4'-kinase [Grimontia hollisae]AMG31719.1 tetraacyldisaccharide 4'-kinase [Grimontia hollisae]EEY70728.1 tetraacyldisaccharide 4'-kinase [Grimontia hollisae CIP 101886]MDF2186095.1 tetraacyldisaccharide 4'-kinase [Grimontia hollisae]STO44953.1 Tetraacyldisaccharide 4'-kinase [Grimontia hollisae]STO57678.1 Tetraacyldisaccharide 4'-kinase [Grimontia hollisae]